MAQKPRGRPRQHEDSTDGTVQALDRALMLMGHLARHPGLTLSDLAAETGQSLATTFRALATLQAHGWTEVEEPGSRWHVGPGAFRIGSAFLARGDLLHRARRPMEELQHETGETVSLAVARRGQVVVLAQIAGTAPLRADLPAGMVLPAHASAAGKALLAHLPEEEAAALTAGGLTRLTGFSHTSDSALSRDLARIRDRGHAVEDQEWMEGQRGLAAAVFDAAGGVAGALAVTGPVFRLGLSETARVGALVRAAAEIVSESLGLPAAG